ncbi:MAG: GNAT family N-acetyltransferase [Phycisphaerales bacterium]|nr:GNAT family N-acetyltransferase [Phycisphaerales bacterium]
MGEQFEYGAAAGEAECAALGEILGRTFHFPTERVPRFFDTAGRENLRVLRQGGAVVGGLVIVHMGQFFGGRAVKMAGIAAVGIDPHARGLGAASALMREAVNEMHAMGYPISSLYPATQPLYRRVGYEQAGTFYRCVLPTASIDSRRRDLAIRPMTGADQSAVERCYLARARACNGHLDRKEYVWSRVRRHRGAEASGFLVQGANGLEGYAWIVQEDSPSRPYNLYCTDLVAITSAAAERLLAFFADHRSMAGEVIWHGHPSDAIHLNLREQSIRDEVKDQWMLRLLDAAAAIEARGYWPGASVETHLEVHGDEVLPHINNGRLLLRIARGRAEARRGQGRGDVRVHIRGLAALYSGFLSPWQARAAGWLEGDDDALDGLAGAFVGPAPWLADHF